MPVPERLARFLPSEWEGDPVAALDEWKHTRRIWSEMNPGSLIGDRVDQLGAAVAARRALSLSHPQPTLPAQRRGLGDDPR